MIRLRGLARAAALLLAAATVPGGPAVAATGTAAAPSPAPELPEQKTLLGDLDGVRPWLAGYGASFDLSETSEVLGNFTGGVRQGAIYEGLSDLGFRFDLRPYYQWPGVFFVRAYQIHGRGLSGNNVGNLATISSIEATRTTRLFELWFEQHVGDWLHIRVGQQNAGQEFIVSSTAQLFVNATFGWPTLPAADLPSGGPTYPLATPALRFKVDASDDLTFFAGAFNGDPAGPGSGDPQRRDPSGTALRTHDGVLALTEMRYHPRNSDGAGTYRLGAWFNSERFADQRFASNGVSLASPASTGRPRLYNGDFSLYAIIDQPLFRAGNSDRGLSVFARAMGAPGDRNLVDLYLDGGATYKGIFGDGDTLGLAAAYARIGPAARRLDADTAAFTGQPTPIRSSETALELTYQIPLLPWWQVQPDFQYIINAGGGIANPLSPSSRIGNALVGGLRTTIAF